MRLKLFLRFFCFCFAIFAGPNFASAQNGEIDISALLKKAKQKTGENWQKMLESFPIFKTEIKQVETNKS